MVNAGLMERGRRANLAGKLQIQQLTGFAATGRFGRAFMETRTLGTTGLKSSALGFGCVRLASHPSRRDAVRVLNVALECGITHFDVARLYGGGEAESILGQFLRGKRERVTVATKFGLLPPAGLAGNRRIVGTVKKILGPFPGLLRMLKRGAGLAPQGGAFTPAEAEASLETSLRKLGTDYVDILLLHECRLADATSEPLIAMLERQIAAGKVRCVGVATEFGKLPADAAMLPAIHQMIQFNHNAKDRNLMKWKNLGDRGLITHGIFDPAGPLAEAIKIRPDVAKRAAGELNADLFDANVIRSFLLHYNLQTNPRGVALFSSTSEEHIRKNVRSAESGEFDERRVRRFVEYVDEMLV
jgi:aryl-alcohol dehydrogenase-like predicted oxidoreductase